VNHKVVLVLDNIAKSLPLLVFLGSQCKHEEWARLVRVMFFTNAAAGLAYGDGNAVLCGDSKIPKPKKIHICNK